MSEPILLDTMPLRDQRSMVDVDRVEGMHKTIDDVKAAWQRWADREGLIMRRRAGDTSTELRHSRKTVQIYISGGKWIGECPNCRDGVAGWPLHMEGCCLGCGTIYKLEYPPADEIPRIVELMQARPEQHRHYHPQLGETLHDLEQTQDRYVEAERGSIDLASLREILDINDYEKVLAAAKGDA